MKKVLFAILMVWVLSPVVANAWNIIGKQPPVTHVLVEGSYKQYASSSGSVRYYPIVESSKCDSIPKLAVIPSTAYSLPKSGLYMQYKSPTGLNSYWPVSFEDECIVIITPSIPSEPTTPIPSLGECNGKFICRADWGWVVRVTPQQSIQCIEIRIEKGQALIYEALQVEGTKTICPR